MSAGVGLLEAVDKLNNARDLFIAAEMASAALGDTGRGSREEKDALGTVLLLAVKDSQAGIAMVEAVRLIEPVPKSQIETLFEKWLVSAVDGPQPKDDENWFEFSYAKLQAQIVGMEPTTARDLAIQLYVDTHQFGSDHSEQFEGLVMRLVGVVRS